MTKQVEITFQAKPKNPRFIDIEGQKFHRLTVVGFAECRPNGVYWFCQCDCGNVKKVNSSNLRKGDIKSCGCWLLEFTANLNRTHGKSKSAEYAAYLNAKTRCNNPNRVQYKDYGGRGIEFRFNSFEDFFAEVGRKPPQHSIERIDNNGHYEKGNVKWATKKQQARNQSKTRFITIGQSTKSVSEWAEISGIGESVIRGRIDRLNWCETCATSIKTQGKIKCIHK